MPETMNNVLYFRSLGFADKEVTSGGQHLILHDIIACLEDCKRIYIPFACPVLEFKCRLHNVEVEKFAMKGCDVVYWGTPTIVDDKVLFPDSVDSRYRVDYWNKNTERCASRNIARGAEIHGLKKIITGLGSGDITINERLHDMGGGTIVSYKKFNGFEDWVLLRVLK